MSANPLATLGKLGDLKRRLWFLVGALVVYRIGTFIPVPGQEGKVALVAGSSQVLDLADSFFDIFDAITSTFRFAD